MFGNTAYSPPGLQRKDGEMTSSKKGAPHFASTGVIDSSLPVSETTLARPWHPLADRAPGSVDYVPVNRCRMGKNSLKGTNTAEGMPRKRRGVGCRLKSYRKPPEVPTGF